MRRLVQGGGLSINREKVENPDLTIGSDILLNGKYLLVQKGKKNYYLIRIT
jgi:tyrosyl-tRNA synthetase